VLYRAKGDLLRPLVNRNLPLSIRTWWTGPAWWCWYHWERGGYGEKAQEGENGVNTVYTCM
jgi:hypothetical protein